MEKIDISKDIVYIGCDDKEIDLFESQYVVPNGMAYNSYLIKDKKIAIMDTIDERKTEEWFIKLNHALDGRKPDYLIVSHMEPDHASNIKNLIDKYPDIKIVGNAKTFEFINQFFDISDLDNRKVLVKDGEELSLGKHTLKFFMAPMVHWPEVMVEYDMYDKVIFSADAFGKFGTLDTKENWDCEARRYYFNIVGKYGIQVQALLKKLATLDIKTICPLHGPILKENLEHYISKYDIWSKYEPEDKGIFIACSSIHGNTMNAARYLKSILEKKENTKVVLTDLTRDDMAEAIEDAFRYDRIILMSSSYNMGLFPPMEQFLNHLLSKNFQKRKVGIVGNGSWAPSAAKCMREIISKMKDIELIEPIVTIKSTLKNSSKEDLEKLAENIINY